MNGYQLTFYTEQYRKHGHLSVCDWLLHEVRELGIGGATVVGCAEGIGHAGAHHAAHILQLTDQPLQIIMAVTEEEADRILDLVRQEHVHVFYTRSPIEFGLLGDDAPEKKRRHFSLFHHRRRTGHQPSEG